MSDQSTAETDHEDTQGNVIPGTWRNGSDNSAVPTTWLDYRPVCSNNYSNEARLIREEFKEYFNLEGAVYWQWRQCGLDCVTSK